MRCLGVHCGCIIWISVLLDLLRRQRLQTEATGLSLHLSVQNFLLYGQTELKAV